MKIVAGNWKMYKTIDEAQAYVREIAALGAPQEAKVQAILFPNYVALGALSGSGLVPPWLSLGAQDVSSEAEGAFTGEVSPAMIVSAGARYALVGHSERRHIIGESDDLLRRKLANCLTGSITPVLCVGETIEERRAGAMRSVIFRQLDAALADVTLTADQHLLVAYEPVWAIGTGENATPEQIEEAHSMIRQHLASCFGDSTGNAIPLLYGGSVKPSNFASIVSLPSVDGGLIGGASLKAGSFWELLEIAGRC